MRELIAHLLIVFFTQEFRLSLQRYHFAKIATRHSRGDLAILRTCPYFRPSI